MRLTERQCVMVALIRDGHDTESIMEELDVSRQVVRRNVRAILAKVGAENGARLPDIPALVDLKGECDGGC
jgi:DNA-binding NarL/FixJ family response regulator